MMKHDENADHVRKGTYLTRLFTAFYQYMNSIPISTSSKSILVMQLLYSEPSEYSAHGSDGVDGLSHEHAQTGKLRVN